MSAELYPTTPARAAARATRRTQLEREVQTVGRCTTPDPHADADVGDWFRGDGEDLGEWAVRRRDLIDHCNGCPVAAACAELALRYDDRGDLEPRRDLHTYDDHVRGGLTAYQLAQIRKHREHRPSIRAAVDADQQRAAVNAAYVVLQREAITIAHPIGRPEKNSRTRAAAPARTGGEGEPARPRADRLRAVRRDPDLAVKVRSA